MVCGFSAGVTVGIIDITTGGIMGRGNPGTPGIWDRETAGRTLITPGGRGGNGG